MTICVRLSGDVPTMEKAFFRNAFASIIALLMIIKEKPKGGIKPLKGSCKYLFLRCLFGTTGLVSNFYAIDHLGIADANMLNKLSPFFAIIVSIWVLKEKPKRVDIIATIIAFVGAILIIRPEFNISSVPSLVGLYGGLGAGTAYVFVRKLGKQGERTSIIVFYFSLFSTIFTIPFIAFDYQSLSLKQLIILILAGLFASVGQFGITSAYKYAPAKEISVFDYSQVLFAALLGIIFLKETPVPLSVLGYVIIIGIAVIRWRINLQNEN